MRKLLVAAAVVAVVVVPTASASGAQRVKLALVPLPRPVIGSAAQGFSLAPSSGVVSNAAAASSTRDGTAAKFRKLGRLSGYVVEYGDAFTGAPGITDVHTGIEQYKTARDARRGLAFWQKEDSKLGAVSQPGYAVTNVLVHVPAVGKKRFAHLTSYSASNIAPVSGLDEQVLEGRYILDVIVTAGTPAAARKLAKKLDARLRLALEGRLRGKPVKLPAKAKPGPPPGGPDLSLLALEASDLTGQVTVDKGYLFDPAAISDYSVFMLPAGQFDVLDQEIEWYRSANEGELLRRLRERGLAGAAAHDGARPEQPRRRRAGKRDRRLELQLGPRGPLDRPAGGVHLPERPGRDGHRRSDECRAGGCEQDRRPARLLGLSRGRQSSQTVHYFVV